VVIPVRPVACSLLRVLVSSHAGRCSVVAVVVVEVLAAAGFFLVYHESLNGVVVVVAVVAVVAVDIPWNDHGVDRCCDGRDAVDADCCHCDDDDAVEEGAAAGAA